MPRACTGTGAATTSAALQRAPARELQAAPMRALGCLRARRCRRMTPACGCDARMRDGACASAPEPRLSGAPDVDGRLRAQEVSAQLLPRRLPTRKVEGVDDRHPKAARGHGMALRRFILVEGDLHARHAGPGGELLDQCRRGMAIAAARRAK